MTAPLRVLLASGWATPNAIWSPTQLRLERLCAPIPVEWYFLDDVDSVDDSKRWDLAAGHSAGLLRLLMLPWLTARAVVSISGFTRFCQGADFEAGWHPRIVQRMIRQLTEDPSRVLTDFWAKGHATEGKSARPPAPFSLETTLARVDALGGALEMLRNADGRVAWKSQSGHRCVIAGTDDRIVSAAHTVAGFGDEVEWIGTDSHWLPWDYPETCALLLHETLNQSGALN